MSLSWTVVPSVRGRRHAERPSEVGHAAPATMTQPNAEPGANQEQRSRILSLPSGLSWGLVDQVLSSATNFGLALLAGRSLGPGGLGAISVAFSVYLLVLGFQRGLVTDPIVVASANMRTHGRKEAAASALAIVLIGAPLAALAMAGMASIIGGAIGRAFALFAVWLVPALVQDFWRAILFRDQRGQAAAANDGVWAVCMLLAAIGLWRFHSDWSIVAAWGVGALIAGLFGFVQTNIRPHRPANAWRTWSRSSWPLGRWLGLDVIALNVGTQGAFFLLSAIVSTQGLGGLRATQAIFAPLSLIGPALALPGLPAMKVELDVSERSARNLALKLSSMITVLTVLYFSIVGPAGSWLLQTFFGEAFRPFSTLIIPVGLGQVLWAWAVGMILLLKAMGRGRSIFLSRMLGSTGTLVCTWVLALRFGVMGGAWGMVFAPAAWAVCTTWMVLRRESTFRR